MNAFHVGERIEARDLYGRWNPVGTITLIRTTPTVGTVYVTTNGYGYREHEVRLAHPTPVPGVA